jgi:hypothetical protein
MSRAHTNSTKDRNAHEGVIRDFHNRPRSVLLKVGDTVERHFIQPDFRGSGPTGDDDFDDYLWEVNSGLREG